MKFFQETDDAMSGMGEWESTMNQAVAKVREAVDDVVARVRDEDALAPIVPSAYAQAVSAQRDPATKVRIDPSLTFALKH